MNKGPFSPELIAFCCEHSAYQAADVAGRMRLHYPDNIKVIRVPCAGRVDVLLILKAFENGADGVLVMGCHEGACQHLNGNIRARERVRHTEILLKESGIDGERIRMVNLAPETAYKFVQEVTEMTERVKELGPSPVKKGGQG